MEQYVIKYVHISITDYLIIQSLIVTIISTETDLIPKSTHVRDADDGVLPIYSKAKITSLQCSTAQREMYIMHMILKHLPFQTESYMRRFR